MRISNISSTYNPQPNFGHYRDYIASRQKTTITDVLLDGVTKVDTVSLLPVYQETSTNQTRRKKAERVIFPDHSAAFIKPGSPSKRYIANKGDSYLSSQLKERGAYLFNQLMGFQIIPETELIARNSQPHIGVNNSKKLLVSIQEEIQGFALDRLNYQENIDISELINHPDIMSSTLGESLIELYLYVLIANDTDKVSENILYSPQEHRLYSIDNEFSGSELSTKVYYDELSTTFSPKIRGFYNNQRISESYLKRLRWFTLNPSTVFSTLSPYYSNDAINNMLKRASIILNNGRLVPVNELCKQFEKELNPT